MTHPIPPAQRRKRVLTRTQPVLLTGETVSAWTEGAEYRFDCAINDLARAVALRLAAKKENVCQPLVNQFSS